MSGNDVLLLLLLEEIEEEEILLLNCKDNAEVHPIYKQRLEEGCYRILINRNLVTDDRKLREYFRLNIAQFNFILDLVRDDIKSDGSHGYQYPITPEEKLALTLRYVIITVHSIML